MVRTKKKELPRGAGEEDRKHFANARSYMVRIDELVACRNIRCRKRFELTGQSVVLTSDAAHSPAPTSTPKTSATANPCRRAAQARRRSPRALTLVVK